MNELASGISPIRAPDLDLGEFTDASSMAPGHDEGMIFRRRLTPVRAVRVISFVTLLVTLVSGAAMRLADGKEFPTIGRGLWWAAETVTTVGYGDQVPHTAAGRVLAVVVMLSAIAFLTVFTAAITAALIERERHRYSAGGPSIELRLQEISDRLVQLEGQTKHQSPGDWNADVANIH